MAIKKTVVLGATLLGLLTFLPPAWGKVYLEKDEALKLAFPQAEKVEKKVVWFSEEESREIESRLGRKRKRVTLYMGSSGGKPLGYAVIDNVIGKKEFITYMVALNTRGVVEKVEILVFRESQGFEVQNESWRDQFIGKGAGDRLKLKKDIANISGATLSCRAITKGVKKITVLLETILKRKELGCC